jgi:hypothetical protein
MSPSIDTLSAILDALGTTLTGFFSDLQSSVPYTPFYAASDLVEIGKIDAISYRVIGMNYPNRSLLMLHETYAVGADTGRHFHMLHKKLAWSCAERLKSRSATNAEFCRWGMRTISTAGYRTGSEISPKARVKSLVRSRRQHIERPKGTGNRAWFEPRVHEKM